VTDAPTPTAALQQAGRNFGEVLRGIAEIIVTNVATAEDRQVRRRNPALPTPAEAAVVRRIRKLGEELYLFAQDNTELDAFNSATDRLEDLIFARAVERARSQWDGKI
jgi:hypothetical protein